MCDLINNFSFFLLFCLLNRIKIRKHTKQSWPPAPWPVQHQPQISWPPSGALPNIDLSESWPSIPQAPQSSPPTSYLSDQSVKQGIEQYLTSYLVKDGPGLNYALNSGYNQAPGNSAYGSAYGPGPSYGRPPRPELVEARRPLAPSKSAPIKKPAIFGQPQTIDEYENGKGSAAAYNNDAYNDVSSAPAKSSPPQQSYVDNNRVQFQDHKQPFPTSVSADYGGSSYSDSNSAPHSGYKSQNEINYEDNRIRSVSGDYAGNQGDSSNDGNYEESNELINANENVKDTPTYNTNSVPAVRLPGYNKKKAKV